MRSMPRSRGCRSTRPGGTDVLKTTWLLVVLPVNSPARGPDRSGLRRGYSASSDDGQSPRHGAICSGHASRDAGRSSPYSVIGSPHTVGFAGQMRLVLHGPARARPEAGPLLRCSPHWGLVFRVDGEAREVSNQTAGALRGLSGRGEHGASSSRPRLPRGAHSAPGGVVRARAGTNVSSASMMGQVELVWKRVVRRPDG
jgi:hypothetical protein